MKHFPETNGNLHSALALAKNDYIPVAMLPGQKVPAEKWARWLTEPVTPESIYERWGKTRNGIAVLCQGLVVLDVDVANELDFVLDRTGLKDAPICKTPGGGYHVHGRLRKGMERGWKIRVKGREVDLLTGTSLSIVPDSTNELGVPYEWLNGDELPPLGELPVARLGWARERVRQVITPTEPINVADLGRMEKRAAAWLLKADPAIRGAGGHNALFRCACKLTHFFGLDRDTAIELLLSVYNPRCLPEWTMKEIEHKVTDAIKKK